MKLQVFYAEDGDCLMLTSSDGRRALIDGGRPGSFQKGTWPVLQDLAKRKKAVDLIVVSHIDADHISGILWLLKAVAAWTLFDHQTTVGDNPGFPRPEMPRPPEIKGLWHNSWRAQLAELSGPIEAYLGSVSDALETASRAGLPDAALEAIDAVEGLAESIPQGVELLRTVDEATPIPRNKPFKKLVLLQEPPHVEKLGKARLTVIGPAQKHLEALRDEWVEWLTKVKPAPAGAEPPPPAQGGPAGARLATLAALGVGAPVGFDRADDERLVASLAAGAEIIHSTDASKVTPPNRASITLLAEEAGRTCLLTGDAAEEEIIEGLIAAGRIVDDRFDCNVVKIQHHGSEHNLSEDFAKKVIAEQYVFSADGAHKNPDPRVVATVIESRSGFPGPFTLWFNCSVKRTKPDRKTPLKEAIAVATAAAAKNPAITVNVLSDSSPFDEITI